MTRRCRNCGSESATAGRSDDGVMLSECSDCPRPTPERIENAKPAEEDEYPLDERCYNAGYRYGKADAQEEIRKLREELRLQDEANDILTRQMDDLNVSHARLRGLMYTPTEITEWRKWAACCSTEESGDAADQAIAKCTQYFRQEIEALKTERVELLKLLAEALPELRAGKDEDTSELEARIEAAIGEEKA